LELYIICNGRKRRKGKWCEGEEWKGDEESARERKREREREREMRGREEEKEEGATRLHRSRSTVCKPSSIIKFLLARARARYTKVVLFLFRIVESCKNPFIALELKFDFCYDEVSVAHALIADLVLIVPFK